MATTDTTSDWANRIAPDIETIELMAREAYAHFPESFRHKTAGVEILVTDYPDEDVADMLGLETPFDLLGLFEGRGSEGHWTPATTDKHNRITLFRRAILDYWAENDEALGDIIVHVILHELGHHFGVSEAEIERIEAAED